MEISKLRKVQGDPKKQMGSLEKRDGINKI